MVGGSLVGDTVAKDVAFRRRAMLALLVVVLPADLGVALVHPAAAGWLVAASGAGLFLGLAGTPLSSKGAPWLSLQAPVVAALVSVPLALAAVPWTEERWGIESLLGVRAVVGLAHAAALGWLAQQSRAKILSVLREARQERSELSARVAKEIGPVPSDAWSPSASRRARQALLARELGVPASLPIGVVYAGFVCTVIVGLYHSALSLLALLLPFWMGFLLAATTAVLRRDAGRRAVVLGALATAAGAGAAAGSPKLTAYVLFESCVVVAALLYRASKLRRALWWDDTADTEALALGGGALAAGVFHLNFSVGPVLALGGVAFLGVAIVSARRRTRATDLVRRYCEGLRTEPSATHRLRVLAENEVLPGVTGTLVLERTAGPDPGLVMGWWAPPGRLEPRAEGATTGRGGMTVADLRRRIRLPPRGAVLAVALAGGLIHLAVMGFVDPGLALSAAFLGGVGGLFLVALEIGASRRVDPGPGDRLAGWCLAGWGAFWGLHTNAISTALLAALGLVLGVLTVRWGRRAKRFVEEVGVGKHADLRLRPFRQGDANLPRLGDKAYEVLEVVTPADYRGAEDATPVAFAGG